jgi:prevent-host-death family protein
MTSEVPVTQAREELADLVNRVAYGHERIILTRHAKPVACLVPPEDLARLQEQEQPDQEPATVGLAYPDNAPGSQRPPVPTAPMPIAAHHRSPGQPSG